MSMTKQKRKVKTIPLVLLLMISSPKLGPKLVAATALFKVEGAKIKVSRLSEGTSAASITCKENPKFEGEYSYLSCLQRQMFVNKLHIYQIHNSKTAGSAPIQAPMKISLPPNSNNFLVLADENELMVFCDSDPKSFFESLESNYSSKSSSSSSSSASSDSPGDFDKYRSSGMTYSSTEGSMRRSETVDVNSRGTTRILTPKKKWAQMMLRILPIKSKEYEENSYD